MLANRPKLDIDKVATGEHWYGIQALELNLVDEIKTSDELLIAALEDYDIYEIKKEMKKGLQEKLLGGLFAGANVLRNKLAAEENHSKYH